MNPRKPGFWILIGVVAIVVLYVFAAPHSTKTTEVGVRIMKWNPFGTSGIVPQIYPPGSTYFFPRIINEWHTFDTRLQNIEMTMSPPSGRRGVRDDLLFKTIDGNDISLDAIISYRIDPSKVPLILESVAIDNRDLEENVVRPISRNITRDLFGELTTEDFYNADKRTERSRGLQGQAQRGVESLRHHRGERAAEGLSLQRGLPGRD
jgi:regulator of protease activity HflC (stomatin/prohibitin superfamily)